MEIIKGISVFFFGVGIFFSMFATVDYYIGTLTNDTTSIVLAMFAISGICAAIIENKG